MREIKFRAWGPNTKHMWDWDELRHIDLLTLTTVGEKILMQFTGLQDKNGVDIYEGDILFAHMNEALYVVKHGLYIHSNIDNDGESPDCYGWYLHRTSDHSENYGESLEGSKKFLESKGNIYENPELLPNHQ